MRNEVRVCEKLIAFTHQNGGLTDEECEAVMFYARELEREILPLCAQHHRP